MQSREYRNYLIRCRRQRPDVKAKERAYFERYKAEHPDFREKKRESDKRLYEKHRTQRIATINRYNARSCRDPVVGDVCKYNTLVQRIRHHKDWYGDIKPIDCLIKVPTIKGLDDKLKEEYNLE